MSTHDICFYGEITKIVPKLSLNTLLICSTDFWFQYDSTVIIKSEPLILEGGYEQWLLHYPTRCINPDFRKIQTSVQNTSQASLSKFDISSEVDNVYTPKPLYNTVTVPRRCFCCGLF